MPHASTRQRVHPPVSDPCRHQPWDPAMNAVTVNRSPLLVLLACLGAGWTEDAQPVPTTRRFPYVGACLSTHPRLALVPGRVYLDFQGKPCYLPTFLAHQGFNAIRVFANHGEPRVAPPVDNS